MGAEAISTEHQAQNQDTGMKRVRCPKCENYITFDETKYGDGQSLVFVCEHCKKQFSIRLGKSKAQPQETKPAEATDWGSIHVIENVFAYKQVLPLHEGDNIIGRRSLGTTIDTPIETSDMSMDRRHCIINVKRDKEGNPATHCAMPPADRHVSDHDLLGDKERVRIEDEAIVTIGATTFILYAPKA